MDKELKLWPSNKEFVKGMIFLGKFFYYTGTGHFQKKIRYDGRGYEKKFVMNWWHPFTWIYAAVNAFVLLISGIILALGAFVNTLVSFSIIRIEGPLKINKEPAIADEHLKL